MNASHPPQRVLLIGNNVGSVFQFRVPLIKRLVAMRIETHLLVPTEKIGLINGYDEQIAALHDLGATVHEYELHRTGINAIQDARSFMALFRAIRAIRPNVVISNMMKPVVYGTLAAWLAGVPRRYAMLDGLGVTFASDGTGSAGRAIAKFLLRRALKDAHHLILLNSDDPETLRREGVIHADYPVTIVAGTGIDLTHYACTPTDLASRTFVMIARLIREKGVREFGAAAAIVRRRFPKARFELIGEVDTNPGAIGVDEVRGWETIDYLGPQRDVRPFVQAALALVLPSYYGEGRPRTVMEAMSMGRAAIIADNRGSRDCVADGVNGRVVPPRDAQSLAAAMINYLENPQSAAAHGLQGRSLAENVYEEGAVVTAILHAFSLDR